MCLEVASAEISSVRLIGFVGDGVNIDISLPVMLDVETKICCGADVLKGHVRVVGRMSACPSACGRPQAQCISPEDGSS